MRTMPAPVRRPHAHSSLRVATRLVVVLCVCASVSGVALSPGGGEKRVFVASLLNDDNAKRNQEPPPATEQQLDPGVVDAVDTPPTKTNTNTPTLTQQQQQQSGEGVAVVVASGSGNATTTGGGNGTTTGNSTTGNTTTTSTTTSSRPTYTSYSSYSSGVSGVSGASSSGGSYTSTSWWSTTGTSTTHKQTTTGTYTSSAWTVSPVTATPKHSSSTTTTGHGTTTYTSTSPPPTGTGTTYTSTSPPPTTGSSSSTTTTGKTATSSYTYSTTRGGTTSGGTSTTGPVTTYTSTSPPPTHTTTTTTTTTTTSYTGYTTTSYATSSTTSSSTSSSSNSSSSSSPSPPTPPPPKPPPVPCEYLANCTECATRQDCGWCGQTHACMACAPGTNCEHADTSPHVSYYSTDTSSNPAPIGSCEDGGGCWHATNATCPSLPCRKHTDCGSCASESNCAWCTDKLECVEVTQSGGVVPCSGSCACANNNAQTCPSADCEKLTDCATCVDSNCGWCGVKGMCFPMSTDGMHPCNGTCDAPYSSYMYEPHASFYSPSKPGPRDCWKTVEYQCPAVSMCESLSDCFNCTKANCYWCGETQTCMEDSTGTSTPQPCGGVQCNSTQCGKYDSSMCPWGVCTDNTDCSSCVKNGCHWCGLTQTCLEASTIDEEPCGGKGGSCGPSPAGINQCWKGELDECPAVKTCNEMQNCAECTATKNCGWCSAGAGKCLEARTTGTLDCAGDCTPAQWSYSNCDNACAAYLSCSDCAKVGGCGWCAGYKDSSGEYASACVPDTPANKAVCTKWHNSTCPNCDLYTACGQCVQHVSGGCGWCHSLSSHYKSFCVEGENGLSFEWDQCENPATRDGTFETLCGIATLTTELQPSVSVTSTPPASVVTSGSSPPPPPAAVKPHVGAAAIAGICIGVVVLMVGGVYAWYRNRNSIPTLPGGDDFAEVDSAFLFQDHKMPPRSPALSHDTPPNIM